MLIDKTEIEKAKDILGDNNAYFMAEMLGLDDIDTKNLKACCPYHKEETASFIYNKKNKTFHCFGCSKTVDIIDVLMEKGYTFLGAAKELFEKAEMDYSFGEQNVKTKRDYKYPHEEQINDKKNIVEYLSKRGISKNTIDYLDIREDSNSNAVFNFYDTNDVLTMVKYRPARTVQKQSGAAKTWCQKGADTSHLLFNMNRINTSKPLLITEGEIDTASAIEAGYLNTTSVPLGAGNLHWIEENWEWLDEFESIIIWADNDEAGEKMRKDCVYRLGTWRTKYIITPKYFKRQDGKKIPLKDINDCLQIGGKDFVMKLILEAKDVPVKSVVDYSDVQELDISQMDGVKTGLKSVDDKLLKLYYGTLTIVSGRPSSGKTSLLDQIIIQSIDDDKPVFLFSKEMPERLTTSWLNSILAGRRNLSEKTAADGNKYYVVPYTIQKKMQSYYSKKLFIYRDDEPNDTESVMKSAEECVRKYGCKFIVLDNLMMLDLHCSTEGKNDAQTDFFNSLIKFAAKFNVAVVCVCHPRKTEKNDTDISMYDIAGTSNIINLAMRSIGLRRVSDKEKEDTKCKWRNYDVVLTIIKDRLFGKMDLQVGLWYDKLSRRFYTNYREYDMQFKWDKAVYTEQLPYVDRLKALPDEVSPFN